MAETIVLDPSELAEERTQFDISPWVRFDGVDWGAAEVEPYRAESDRGENVIASRLPNRQITIPLVLRETGGTTFAKARSYIQAKAALAQREGLILRRITPAGGTAYLDVVSAGLTLSGDTYQARSGVAFDVKAELRLEAIPDFYEPEVLLAESEETSAAELLKVISDPGGDMPARVRIIVEDKQAEAQRSLIWAFRSRYYSAATTAKTAYQAEEMQALGSSAAGSLTGASNGTAVSNTALPSVFTPVLGTNLGGTSYLTHKGTNRVYARLRSPDGTAVSAKLVWDVGDLVNPTENEAWTFPAGSAFFVADLGEVRLNPAPVGTHRWQARIDAKGTEGGEDINVDKVWIVNEDEGMGVLSAPPRATTGELKAWDNFNTHAAGTLTGKVASLGGAWTGAGDAVGFTIDTTNHWITREEKSDADLYTGYYARLGTATATSIDVSLDLYMPEIGSALFFPYQGIFVRYENTSNWVMVVCQPISSLGYNLRVLKRSAGPVSELGRKTLLRSLGSWQTLRVTVGTGGRLVAYIGQQGSTPDQVITVSDSFLETAGGFGIYDAATEALTYARKYDNFIVTVPAVTLDAVVFPSQKAQLTTQGMYRLDTGGSAYGPVSRVIGDLPRLPAGNIEGRSSELFVKNSAGDMEELPDSSIPDLKVQVYASRSWLTLPGTI